jgi:hypothetical protein
MKTLLSLALFGTVLTSTTVKTFAGDREWATVGKVLTGVAAVHVIYRIVNPPQPVVVYQQPVVVQPAPVVITPVVVQPTSVVYVQPTPIAYYGTPQVIVYSGCNVPVYRYHVHHHWR